MARRIGFDGGKGRDNGAVRRQRLWRLSDGRRSVGQGAAPRRSEGAHAQATREGPRRDAPSGGSSQAAARRSSGGATPVAGRSKETSAFTSMGLVARIIIGLVSLNLVMTLAIQAFGVVVELVTLVLAGRVFDGLTSALSLLLLSPFLALFGLLLASVFTGTSQFWRLSLLTPSGMRNQVGEIWREAQAMREAEEAHKAAEGFKVSERKWDGAGPWGSSVGNKR